jgi:hypothetical protein
LDVARGIAEPQAEDDDEDDEDFVPPLSEDGEPEDRHDAVEDDDDYEDEQPESVSVSKQELSELIAETRADNSSRKSEDAPLKKKKMSHSVPVSAVMQSKAVVGFSRDQCVQLQVRVLDTSW